MNEIQQTSHTSHSKLYLSIFGALAVLTLLTVAVSYIHLARPGAIAVALLIAFIKVSLITAFFMHLKMEKKWIHGIFYTAVFFAILLLLLVLPDLGWGCSVCFGEGNEEVQRGFFWGILLLLSLPVILMVAIGSKIFFATHKKGTSGN